MLIFSGVVSVLFGLIVLIAPGAGALGLVWVIAAYSIVFGISFVALAFRCEPQARGGRGVARTIRWPGLTRNAIHDLSIPAIALIRYRGW